MDTPYFIDILPCCSSLTFLVQGIGDENDDNECESQSEAEDEATRLHHYDGHDDDKEAPIVRKVVVHSKNMI